MIDLTSQMMNRITNLNTENERIAYQMSTGNIIDKGSDDSVLFASVINIEDKLRVYDGLNSQIQKTTAQNNVSDSSLNEVKNTLDQIKSDLLKGLNEGMDDAARGALATNISGFRENLYTVLNTSVDGEYLFSGSDTTQQTFVKDPNYDTNGIINYGGNGVLRNVAVEPNVYRQRGVTAFDTMMYNSSVAGKDEQLTFTEAERIIDENGQEWKLNATKTTIQQYSKNGDLTNPTVEISVTNDGGTPPTYTTDFVQNTVGSVDNSEIRQLSAKHNYFEDLNVMINALNGYATNTDPTDADFGKKIPLPKLTSDEIKAVLRTQLDNSSAQYDATNVGHAELGGRNNVFEVAAERIQSKQTHYNILMQETNGADMSKLAMQSQSLQMTYQALYSTVSKMNQLSLVNFIK